MTRSEHDIGPRIDQPEGAQRCTWPNDHYSPMWWPIQCVQYNTARITLNLPDAANAIDSALRDTLIQQLRVAESGLPDPAYVRSRFETRPALLGGGRSRPDQAAGQTSWPPSGSASAARRLAAEAAP